MLLTFVALAGGCSSAHPAARPSSSSTTAAAATTTTQAPPQYAPSPYAWDRSTAPVLAVGGGPSATLSAALAPQASDQWRVFGTTTDTAGTPTPTVWSSPDGASWTAAPLDPGHSPGRALAAAQYRASTVVVGSTGSGAAQQAAVWLSDKSGGPFSTEIVPGSDGPSVMARVAAGPLGMFATGTVDGRFALWSSPNGRTWSELPAAERVISSSPGARINALLADGSAIYAAGSIGSGPSTDAAVWTSGNGLEWYLVGSTQTAFGGYGSRVIYSLSPLQTGLVAVGAVNNGAGWVPASWISPDGQSWSLPSVDFPGTPDPNAAGVPLGPSGGTAALSVAPVATLVGITEVVATGGGPYGQQAWRSTDGLHWSSLAMPAGAAGAGSWRADVAATSAAGTLVTDSIPGQPYLLFHRPAPAGSTGAAGTWIEPSSNPAVFGPVRPDAVPISLQSSTTGVRLEVELIHRPQTIGPASTSVLTFTSPDGSTWSAAPATPTTPVSTDFGPATRPVPGALTAHVQTGWVAVASPGGPTPEAWTSPNGVTWGNPVHLSASPSVPAESGSSTSGSTRTTPSAAPGGPSFINGLCSANLPATPTSPARAIVAAVGSGTVVTTVAPSPGTPATAVTTGWATAWYSTTGATWTAATVTPAPALGGSQTMSGCLAAGSALLAFGSVSTPGGGSQPALWRSTDGAAWSRLSINGFASGAPAPVISVAASSGAALAVANPDPTADPFTGGSLGARGPAASGATDSAVGPATSVEGVRDALWLSLGDPSTWQLVDTATAPWLGVEDSQLDLAGFAPAGSAGHGTTTSVTTTASTATPASTSTSTSTSGSRSVAAADTNVLPLVVGVVDGRLAVWAGTSSS